MTIHYQQLCIFVIFVLRMISSYSREKHIRIGVKKVDCGESYHQFDRIHESKILILLQVR